MSTKRMYLSRTVSTTAVIICTAIMLALFMGGLITFTVLYIIFASIAFVFLAVICGVWFLIMLFVTWYAPAYAILDDETITVKSLFGKVRTKQRWDNITDISSQVMDNKYLLGGDVYLCIYFNGESRSKWLWTDSFVLRKNMVAVLHTSKNLAMLREHIKNYADYGDLLIKPPKGYK